VLADERGQLVVPILVTGTTRQPRFAPDVRRVAEMKLGDRMPKNPAAKVQDALRRILGRRRAPESESEGK
jgi:hypothetical protein